MIQYFKVLEVNDRGKTNKETSKKLNNTNKNHSSRRHQGRESSDEDTGKNSKKASSTTVPVRTSQRTNPTGKWCATHKSTSHNTSDCRSAAKGTTDQQEVHNIEPRVKSVLKKKVPKEEVHEINEKELNIDSETSDDEENYSMNDVPRCDIRLIINGPFKSVSCKALLDTGSSKTIIDGSSLLEAAGVKTVEAEPIVYHTKDGTFTINKQTNIIAIMPQFSKHRRLEFTAQVDDRHLMAATYDLIIRRDFLSKYKIKFDFSSDPPTIQWDELQLEMVYKVETQSDQVRAKLRMAVNGCEHLTHHSKEQLFGLLRDYQPEFNGSLSIARGIPLIELDLTAGTRPIQSRPIPIPQAKVENFKRDI